jgi:hypothetical protein
VNIIAIILCASLAFYLGVFAPPWLRAIWDAIAWTISTMLETIQRAVLWPVRRLSRMISERHFSR